MPQILIRQIQIGFFCNCNTAVSQNAAEGVNIHAAHKTPFGKIITECMGCVFLYYACSGKIPFEVGFERVDFKGLASLPGK